MKCSSKRRRFASLDYSAWVNFFDRTNDQTRVHCVDA